MLYNPPNGAATVNDSYVGKNVAAGLLGSKVPRLAVEGPQREIVNMLLAAGLSPTNSDFTQLLQAMSIGLWLGTFGGTPNALAATLPGLALTSDGVTKFKVPALVPGMRFHGIIGSNSNTGPATLAISGFATAPGAQPALKGDGTSALGSGDLKAGAIATWVWDGTSFRLGGLLTSDVLALILGHAAPTPLTFTTPGTYTWTAPAGVVKVRIRVQAGGGGGGGSATTANSVASAGGGGAYFEDIVTVVPGTTYGIVVGVGGAAGAGGSSPQSGGTGGTSSFGTGFGSAAGGVGGLPANGAIQTTGSLGGATSGTSATARSRPGLGGGLAYAISSSAYILAQGGSSELGGLTPTLSTATNSNGIGGQGYGGGAQGGSLGGSGGAGAGGFVSLEFYGG